jgi:hypothetical protein
LNTYSPGQSVRFLASASLLGSLYTPVATITVTMHGPLGKLGPGASRTTQTITAVIDSTGQLHADGVIPITASPGPWVTRWLVVGSDAADTGLEEDFYTVQALSF